MDKPKTNGKRNRTAGHTYERNCAESLRLAGFTFVVTSRAENRTRDGEKVDLCNSNELKNGRLPYNIQCKNTSVPIKYHQLLAEMPSDTGQINVVFHKQTKRIGRNFHPVAHYAVLKQDDFIKLIAELHTLKQSK